MAVFSKQKCLYIDESAFIRAMREIYGLIASPFHTVMYIEKFCEFGGSPPFKDEDNTELSLEIILGKRNDYPEREYPETLAGEVQNILIKTILK